MSDHAAVARWRAGIHQQWLAGDPPPEASGHRWEERGGVAVLRAGADSALPLIVYFHGGGYALGSASVAVPITERLAAGCEVLSVEYRLAPEHPYPAAVDDGSAVVDALLSQEEGRTLFLGGDSAGANVALAVSQRRLRAGDAGGIAGLVLLSPHLDHGPDQTRVKRAGDDVDDVTARWLRAAYCGTTDPSDPGPSPLRGVLEGLPPMLIQAGTDDSALMAAVRLARAARLAGVSAELDVWSGLWHAWHYHRDLPEADRALAEVVAYCHRLVDPPSSISPVGPGPD